MTKPKQTQSDPTEISFGEAVARFMKTKPSQLAETLAADVLQQRERAQQRIQKARQEIEDGALPKKRRFRL